MKGDDIGGIKKIVIFFAHPDFDRSRANRGLRDAVVDLSCVKFHDLYETYPDMLLDVKQEQALAASADLLVFMHPFYWYSSPAMIKQWYDMVLERGWAYGDNGDKLKGKHMLIAITTGGSESSYRQDGYNGFSIDQFLTPQHQTAKLCGMNFMPPFVVHSSSAASNDDIMQQGLKFRQHLLSYVK